VIIADAETGLGGWIGDCGGYGADGCQ